MPVDLARVTCDEFTSRLNSTFRFSSGPDHAFDAVLVEAVESKYQGKPGERVGFSLMFLGPVSPIWPQATYLVRGLGSDEMELFIVPVGSDSSGTMYQAVLN